MVGILIDANAFSCVFNQTDSRHSEYLPILRCVEKKQLVYIFGGEKYIAELQRANMLKLFRLKKDIGEALRIEDDLIDSYAEQLQEKVPNRCDDHHIIAILSVSECTLIATEDKRLDEFLKDRTLFPSSMGAVKIYRSRKHAHLLRNSNHTIQNIKP